MSVESEILRIQHNVANTYAAVAEKGGTVPLQPNSANLAEAVASITSSGEMIAGDGLSKDGDTLSVDNPVRGIVTQAEFDALTEAQKASGTYFVDDGMTCSCGEVYSTEERRIGTWFGKPLYRKVVTNISTVTGNIWVKILDPIPNSTIVSIRGFVSNAGPSTNFCFPIPYFISDAHYGCYWYYNVLDTSLNIDGLCYRLTSPDTSGGFMTTIIEYTKTTDPTPTQEVSA